MTGDVLENKLQSEIIKVAKGMGWRVYHVYDSRNTSDAGFPDLVLGHKLQGRIVAAELKRKGCKPTDDQLWWLGVFDQADVENYVWRPADLESGEIYRVLMGIDKRRTKPKPTAIPARMTAEEFRKRGLGITS